MRLAVAFSFLYPPIAALVDPDSWIGYFPLFVLDLAGDHILLVLHAWGVIEVGLALWVLFGVRVYIPSLIMAGALMAVVLLNPGQFPILFRDVSIALAAVALALVNKKKHGTS